MKLECTSVVTHTVREYYLKTDEGKEYLYKEYLNEGNDYVGHELFTLPGWVSMEGTEIEQDILDAMDELQIIN